MSEKHMSEKVEVKIGQTLPAERWAEAAENLSEAFPLLAMVLKLCNFDGLGERDAEEFMADGTLAVIALRYVASCAADKCRFVAIPEREGGGQPCK